MKSRQKFKIQIHNKISNHLRNQQLRVELLGTRYYKTNETVTISEIHKNT